MEDTKRQDKPKRTNGSPELRIVGIDCDPGPDAQDRLRRLFTLLVEHATKDRVPLSEADPPSENDGEADS